MSNKIEDFLILQVSFVNIIILFLIGYFILDTATFTTLRIIDGVNGEVYVDTTE